VFYGKDVTEHCMIVDPGAHSLAVPGAHSFFQGFDSFQPLLLFLGVEIAQVWSYQLEERNHCSLFSDWPSLEFKILKDFE